MKIYIKLLTIFILLSFTSNIYPNTEAAATGVSAASSVVSSLPTLQTDASAAAVQTLITKQTIAGNLEEKGVSVTKCGTASADKKTFNSIYKTCTRGKNCAKVKHTKISEGSCANPAKQIKYNSKKLGTGSYMSFCLNKNGSIKNWQEAVSLCADAESKIKEYQKTEGCSNQKGKSPQCKDKIYSCNYFIVEVRSYLTKTQSEVKSLCSSCNAYMSTSRAASSALNFADALSSSATSLVSDLLTRKQEKDLANNLKDPTCNEKCSEAAKRGNDALLLCLCATDGCGYGLEAKCKEIAGGTASDQTSCEQKLSFLKNDKALSKTGDYNNLLAKCYCEEAGMYWVNGECKGQEAGGSEQTTQDALTYSSSEKNPDITNDENKKSDKEAAKGSSSESGAAASSSPLGAGLGTGKKQEDKKDKSKELKIGALSDPKNSILGKNNSYPYNKNDSGYYSSPYESSSKDAEKEIAAANEKSIFDIIREYYSNSIKANKFMLSNFTKNKIKNRKKSRTKKR